jgi:quercetin dioxygenase-like cupin family protein
MKRTIRLLLFAVCTGFALHANAQADIMEVAPNSNKVILDDSHVRVIEGSLKPGEKTAMHHHPDHMIYFNSGGTVRFTMKDGTTKEMTSKTGEARWNEAVDHQTENIGKTVVKYVIVEPKGGKM